LSNVVCFLGELKVGTDEEVFNRIMAHESFPQLKLIFEEYKNVSGRTIEQALEAELSGELLEAMLAIGNSVLFKSSVICILLCQNFQFVTSGTMFCCNLCYHLFFSITLFEYVDA
jgi:hypothetical protein